VYATIKIAKYLRALFETIEVYVPYEASSGGTVLCLAANTIVMDRLSNLTPIDPQTVYKGEYVSAGSFDQAAKELEEKYGTYRPEQIPSPYQQLCTQLDPIILKEKNKIVLDMVMVAWELLEKSQLPVQPISLPPTQMKEREEASLKLLDIVISLTKNRSWPHSHIIGLDDAKRLRLNVSEDKNKLAILKTCKKWVSQRLGESQTSHVIEHFAPVEVKEASSSASSTVAEPIGEAK